ncbi:MAG TPA: methyltransferase domain-containing protein, partial [Micromonosporaceae bacterium]
HMGSAVVQGALWGAAAEDWAQLTESTSTPIYEAVFDAMGVGPGVRLLDAGCGAGMAMQLAQKRGATVTGFDASAGLLAVARRRLPDARFDQGDLETLPYPDDSFDAITAFNSVQYAADPVAALRELKRVAGPGGQVAAVTWAEPERCEMRVVLAALGALLPPPPPGAGGPFALSAPGRLEELLAAAGLTPWRTGEVPAPFIFADLDTAVRANLASGPARRAIEHAGRDTTEATLREALAGGRKADGTIRHDNAFIYVIATG